MEKTRCTLCSNYGEHTSYHDEEWGVPVHDDRNCFEFLTLDAFQAGLSWLTILKKRKDFHIAFDGFDPHIIAGYREEKYEELLVNEKIIRNRLKIKSTIANAGHFINIQQTQGSFDNYIWGFTDGKVVDHAFEHGKQIPVSTPLSDKISKDLKSKGFNFVGTTTIYAFLQAAGIVNDHLVSCYRYEEVKKIK